jgi:hypothetical protein
MATAFASWRHARLHLDPQRPQQDRFEVRRQGCVRLLIQPDQLEPRRRIGAGEAGPQERVELLAVDAGGRQGNDE